MLYSFGMPISPDLFLRTRIHLPANATTSRSSLQTAIFFCCMPMRLGSSMHSASSARHALPTTVVVPLKRKTLCCLLFSFRRCWIGRKDGEDMELYLRYENPVYFNSNTVHI